MDCKSRSATCEVSLLIVIGLVVRLLFLAIKPAEALSFDTKFWTEAIEMFIHGQATYVLSGVQQYPPFWLPILIGLSKVANFLGVNLLTAVGVFLLFVEQTLLVVLYCLGREVTGSSPYKYLLVGFSLNPISVLQICQHLQIDVIVCLFSVLFCFYQVRWVKNDNPVEWLLACACLGLGIVTKFIPFILCPLLCINYRRLKLEEIALGALLVFGPLVYGLAILFSSGDVQVLHRVFGYRGIGGYFGFTGIFALLDMKWAQELYSKLFVWFLLAVLAAITIVFLVTGWKNKRVVGETRAVVPDPRVILLLVPLLFLVSLLFSSGYGPQYIMWVIPFGPIVFMAVGRKTKRLFLITYVVACLTLITEYALFRSHGAFLVAFFPDGWLQENAVKLSSQAGQTLLRLPLFLFFLASFAATVATMIRLFKNPGLLLEGISS